jgi:uncharacterized protein (TIGR02466 family)
LAGPNNRLNIFMNQSTQFSVHPIFPTVVSGVTVREDLSALDHIKQLPYIDLKSDESSGSYKTEDNELLSSFPEEKRIILDYFTKFKTDVLKLENDFKISSSWATRVDHNGYCQYHDHKNSYYSGVLYLDTVQNGGEIQFQNPVHGTGFLLNPTEWNTFNYEVFYLKPERHLLLFFPSYLLHRINRYMGTESRYSIAMNFVPVGKFGRGDSVVNYELIN